MDLSSCTGAEFCGYAKLREQKHHIHCIERESSFNVGVTLLRIATWSKTTLNGAFSKN